MYCPRRQFFGRGPPRPTPYYIYVAMGRKPTARDRRLSYRLTTHVNEKKYLELRQLLLQSPKMDMSMLIRHILENRKVRIYVHDETLDRWLEELSRVRAEIRAIGVNINQITKQFHTYPEPFRKATYASMAFQEYKNMQTRIESIYLIVGKLSQKWLSE